MSLILDALKKAEAERQRQTGPTLLEVRVTQAPRRLPICTFIIGGLLAINMILLLVFALRRPGTIIAATPAAAAPATVTATAATPPPASAPVVAAPPPAIAPLAASTAPASPSLAPVTGDTGADDERNPADDAPAVSARNAPAHRAVDNRATSSQSLPNLSDLGGEMPDLRLDLHVFAERPASRYALINMHTVHEGDVLPEGPSVVEIYRDGVELSYRGTLFMLRPQ
jgi:general secretion pathway protein B